MFHFRTTRTAATSFASGLFVGSAMLAHAVPPETFPSRPIDIVTHASPGGGTDATARTMLIGTREALGVGMAVLPKVGGGGLVAMSYMSARPRDGHTLMGITPTHLFAIARGQGPLEIEDRVGVARATDDPIVVMVRASENIQTLHDLIRKVKRIKEDEAIRIIRQVTNALRHAHRRGFIHRDIKPKNIMLATGGSVKLADLGLAREMSDREAAEAEAGRAYGTPYYISPEQIRGEVTIGPAADIYGLGATFYHMVTGRVPFEGKNPSAVMHKHL